MHYAASEAETYQELFKSLLTISKNFDVENQLDEDIDVTEQPHFAFSLLNACINFLDQLDEITETENHKAISEFVEKLDQQNMLVQASSIVLIYLSRNDEFIYKYGNTFNRKLGTIIDDLVEISQSEEPDPDHLISVFRPWGSLCETALPPVLTLLHFLENDDVDFEKAEELNFKDSVTKVGDFPSLEPIAKRLHVDLRNSVSHGGVKGDYSINPLAEEITFWFEKGGEVQKITMSFENFQEYVLETLSAVISLFLLPVYIVSTHVCIEVQSIQELDDV